MWLLAIFPTVYKPIISMYPSYVEKWVTNSVYEMQLCEFMVEGDVCVNKRILGIFFCEGWVGGAEVGVFVVNYILCN